MMKFGEDNSRHNQSEWIFASHYLQEDKEKLKV